MYYYKESLYDTLSNEYKQEIKDLIKKYEKTTYTLGEVFGMEPEIFKYVPIEDVGYSTRVINGLEMFMHSFWVHKPVDRHLHTLCDVLYLNFCEIFMIRNIGLKSVEELVGITKKYVTEANINGNKVQSSYSYDLETETLYRLGSAMKMLMRGQSVDGLRFTETERPYIDKYKEAVALIDEPLYMSAFNGDRYINNIIIALADFSAPTCRRYMYEQKVEEALKSLKPELKDKPVVPFVFAYYLSVKEPKCSFLNGLSDDMKIRDIHKAFSMESFPDRNLTEAVLKFIAWLDFDFASVADNIFDSIFGLSRGGRAFRLCASGVDQQEVADMFSVPLEILQKWENEEISYIRGAFRLSKYNLVALVRALKGNVSEIYKEDMENILGEDRAKLLWYALQRITYKNNRYYFSKKANAVVFGK